jgi:hypothetical protein
VRWFSLKHSLNQFLIFQLLHEALNGRLMVF